MNELDQRLHHAARRLREMPVDVPSLAALGIDVPAAEPQFPRARAAAKVPAGLAAALLVVGGIVGFSIGQSDAPAVEQAVQVAPTAADRMRDPLLRITAPLRATDEIAMMPSQTRPLRRHVRWS
jgi:hypothetical protein